MHAGRHYSFKEILRWTRRETVVFVCLASIPPVLAVLGVDVAVLPWPPVAVLGTAVAFVTGFKSNAAYGRVWEARQIWGAIVNASRAWGVMVRDFVSERAGGDDHRKLVLRHVAWLTALRHQLREPRAWESQQLTHNTDYQARTYSVPERTSRLEDELTALIGDNEARAILAKKNRAVALLALQSETLKLARANGQVSEFCHVELVRTIATLLEQQGKCERIKNFPYPRQFATLNLIFVWLFIVLLPFGVAAELKKIGEPFVWLTIPVAALVSWVFHTMDKIGESSENPFEGGPNDIPITAMSRGIEIDLRDLLGDTDLPKPHAATSNILM
jgi:ion channel-forming bestrophin family protein